MSLIQQISALAEKCAQQDKTIAAAADAAASAAAAAQQTANEAKSLGTSAYKYKGTVADVASLPASSTEGLEVGDVYNVGSALNGGNYAWNGSDWDSLGQEFTVATGISSDSGVGLVPEGVAKAALDLKVDSTDVGDVSTDFVAAYTSAYTAYTVGA